MRKEDKSAIISQLAEIVKQYGHFYLVDTTAMDAAATSALRRKCFKAGIKMVVVKNSLLEKALGTIEGVDYSPSQLQTSLQQKEARTFFSYVVC